MPMGLSYPRTVKPKSSPEVEILNSVQSESSIFNISTFGVSNLVLLIEDMTITSGHSDCFLSLNDTKILRRYFSRFLKLALFYEKNSKAFICFGSVLIVEIV